MPEPNACLVCDRPDLAEIDAALDAGEGLNATARRFGLSRGAIQRHAKHRDGKPEKAPAAEATPAPTPEPFEPAGSSRLEPGSNLARAGSSPDVAPAAPARAPLGRAERLLERAEKLIDDAEDRRGMRGVRGDHPGRAPRATERPRSTPATTSS